ncbi:MAG: hypothetical protein QOI98_1492, partial [Solirubrobacteraceae bacterium]|nr:hypothetical protein [Solirubrobacteraceae bacterium]
MRPDPQDILGFRGTADGAARPNVLINAGGAISGGAQTHLLAVAEELGRGGDRGLRWEALVPPALADAVGAAAGGALAVREQGIGSPLRRIAWEQARLSRLWSRTGADVLVSVANFGPLTRSRAHVLVAGNALYFADVRVRGRRGLRIRGEAV